MLTDVAFDRLVASTTNPTAGRMVLVSSRGTSITLLLEDDPNQVLPVGGWEKAAVERDLPVTYFGAPGESSLPISAALDSRLVGGPDIGRRLQVLEEMGTRASGDDEPPKVRVVGGNIPRALGRTWVMQSLALGAQVQNPAGAIVRLSVSLGFDEYIKGSQIALVKPGRTRSSSGKRRARVITARKNDTLRAIAVRQLGSPGQWKDIRTWNKALRKVDPDAPLRAGTKVVLR